MHEPVSHSECHSGMIPAAWQMMYCEGEGLVDLARNRATRVESLEIRLLRSRVNIRRGAFFMNASTICIQADSPTGLTEAKPSVPRAHLPWAYCGLLYGVPVGTRKNMQFLSALPQRVIIGGSLGSWVSLLRRGSLEYFSRPPFDDDER